ncbi:MAG: hypothetical protein KatS3mg131_0895 [Candidatus Tectimicrobiota bacterium]|nr:MAG: hypothetical protein KatS3mg131_0895 [Candidatus Tectomicrobia bacterium]
MLTVSEPFVIHVLDHRQPAAQCSQALTPLPDSLRLRLEEYLRAVLRPGFRRKHYGRFRPESPVLREYRRLLTSTNGTGRVEPETFLDVSQRLATLLFLAMRQHAPNGNGVRPGEVAPGDLLVGVCTLQAPEAPATPQLFLIKVDLETALQRQLRPHAAGGVQSVLVPCDNLVPRLTAEHVHKVALIRHPPQPDAYEVLMVDPQGGKAGIARFFAEAFLQVEPFHTPDEQAELLFVRTHRWVQAHEDDLSPRERGEVLQAVRTLLVERAARAEPIVPRELVETLPLREARDEQAVAALRQSLQEALTAPAAAQPLPPEAPIVLREVPPRLQKTRMTYELDGGVQLSGEPEALERLFAVPPHRVDGLTEFTIRTRTFRPLP